MSLFKKSLPLDGEEAEAVYRKLTALMDACRDSRLRALPTLLPLRDFRDLDFDGSERAYASIAARVCRLMQVGEGEVATVFANGDFAQELLASRRASRFEGEASSQGAVAIYLPEGPGGKEGLEGIEGDGKPTVIVFLDQLVGRSLESFFSALAHEYAHHRLRGLYGVDPRDEELADLLPVLQGLGVFMANSALEYLTDGVANYSFWQVSRSGYLSPAALGFALALTSAWRDEAPRPIARSLAPTAKDVFRKTRRLLAANHYLPWRSPGPTSLQRESLPTRLAAEAKASREAKARAEEAMVIRAKVKWQGSFLGLDRVLDAGELPRHSGLDFGDAGFHIPWTENLLFGISYQVLGGRKGQAFELTEAVTGPEGLEEEARILETGVLVHRVLQVGQASCPKPGLYKVEVLFGDEVLAAREFEVGEEFWGQLRRARLL